MRKTERRKATAFGSLKPAISIPKFPPMTDVLRQEIATQSETVVVKVGTRVLTHRDGRLNEQRVSELAEELHWLIGTGRKVVLVSSGAVGAGMGRLKLADRPVSLANLQAVAAVGQCHLIECYDRALRALGRHAAQLLLTAEDLDHRTRYLNVRNTILALMDFGALPIINENDTVAVDELQTTFGDNDRLAALVTNLIRAQLLILLSDVDGLYSGDPADPASRIIPTITQLDERITALVCDQRTGLSKGGMASKLAAARIATAAGENVIIAGGHRSGVLRAIFSGQLVGTLLLAQGQAIAARKRWIGYTVQPRGKLTLDEGACRAISQHGRSLLAIGVTDVSGSFQKGDVVAVVDPQGCEVARGLTNYSADEIRRIQGLRTDQIGPVLGHRPYDEVIHRDNMVLTG
jgi:glutamate 5-kinase